MFDEIQEKISVIVPIYNVEKYLDRCIRSIVMQTYSNLEIILVDDGSPDNCGTICDEWANKDNRIHVIHKKNGGISSARNAGLDIASGSYISFIDSDDFIASHMYDELLRNIKLYEADMIICRIQNFFDEQEITVNTDEKEIAEYSVKEAFLRLYAKDSDFINLPTNKLYRRKLFENLRYTEGILNEDAALIHYILDRCIRIVRDENVLYYRQLRRDSIMGKLKNADSFDIKSMDALFFMKDRVEHYKDMQDRQLYSMMCADYFQTIIVDYCRARIVGNNEEICNKLYHDFSNTYSQVREKVKFDFKKKVKYFLFLRSPKTCCIIVNFMNKYIRKA